MAPLLALDIGDRRTGVAYGDDASGIVFAMDTVRHRTPQELAEALAPVAKAKHISELIVGLPRLPGGEEGEQAAKVRATTGVLETVLKLPVTLVDERFTSQQQGATPDDNTRAAIAILEIVLEKRKKGVDK